MPTDTSPATLTPTRATTETTETPDAPSTRTHTLDLLRVWPDATVATTEGQGQRSIEPNAVARVQTTGQSGDDYIDTITGGGYMPSFINGQMGQWTGAAVASIPIDVPPGPNGQSPYLALTYSSNAIEDVYFQGGRNAPSEDTLQVASSPFGYGWSLDGIPSITRVGRVDAFSDSNNGGFELHLGGETTRIIRKKLDDDYSYSTPASTPVSYLVQRFVYQTYPQRFMYIGRTTKEYTAKTCGYEPLYDESRWEIITKDGTHYEFGGLDNVKLTAQEDCMPEHPDDYNAVQYMTSGGTDGNPKNVLPSIWYVTRITDTHGNVMRFRYRKESMGDPYNQYSPPHSQWGQYDAAVTLSEITYGGTDESQHRVKVVVVPQNYPRRDCTIAINKSGVGTPAPTAVGATPTSTPQWEHWGCGMQLATNEPAGYRSEYLIDRIEVQIKQNHYTDGTPTPQQQWTTIRTYNLDYAFHTRPEATPSIVFSYDRALLDSVTLSDGDIAQDTPVPTAVPTGAASTASPRPPTLTPVATAQQSLPPYQMTYYTDDDTKINWLPLRSFDNGYGGKTEYTYVTTPTPVSCWNAAQNKTKSHGRIPANSVAYSDNGTPVSSSSYEYTGGACSEKFSTGTEGQLGNWYEFLGFGDVSETITDHTPTGTPPVTRFTTTKYYRCRGEGTPGVDACAEATPTGTATPGAYTGAEPHPNKGELLLREVRPQATSDAVELAEEYIYSDDDLESEYIGFSTVSTSIAPWGRLASAATRRYGRTPIGVGTPSTSVSSITTYEYDAAQQQNKQWGNVTRKLDYLSDFDYINGGAYRAERTWYNSRETIDATDFSPSQSTFIVDRPRFRAILGDYGALPSDNPTPVATAEVANVEWFIYDDKDEPTDGLNTQGALAHHVALEKVSDFPSGLASGFVSDCTGVVDRFRTMNKTYSYTTSGGAGNVASETSYAGYGYACVVDPFTGSDVIHIESTYGGATTPSDARVVTKTYDDVFYGLVTSLTNPLSYSTTYKYFGINSTAQPTTSGYFVGQVHTRTDPNNNDVAYAYDHIGRLTKVIAPGDTLDSPTMAYGYSDATFSPPFPSVQSIWTKREADTSPWSDGGTWERTFVDGRGQVVEIQRPNYDWHGNPAAPTPTAVATASGNDVVVHRSYDAVGNLKWETNSYIKAAYNSAGSNPYVTPSSSEYRTRTTYDVAGRPLVITNPDNTALQHHYGVATQAPVAWIDDVMNEEHHRKQTREDSLGRLLSVREYDGDCGEMGFTCGTPYPTTWDTDSQATTVEYQYDVEDKLLTAIEPGGNQTSIEYDLFGRKIGITDPDLGTWSYVYDAADNIAHQVDARNQTVCHYYDSLDRETQRRYIVASAATPSPCMVNQGTGTPTPAGTAGPLFAYDSGTDGKNRRTSSTLVDGSWYTWDYDARGRMKRETQYVTGYDNSGGNGAGLYTTDYTFKSNGDAASLKHPDGLDTLNITYNIGGSDVIQSAPTSQSPSHPDQYFVSQTKYTADGLVDWRVLGPTATAVIQDSDYNAADRRLYRIRAGTVASAPHYKEFMDQYYDDNGLGYDDVGNPTDIDDWVSGSPQEQTLTYDDRDRLISADATGSGTTYGDYGPEVYQYDQRGNIVHRTIVAVGTTVPLTYSYHAAKIHAVRKIYSDATATPTAGGPTQTFTPTPSSGTPAVLPNKSITMRVKRPAACSYDVDIVVDYMINDASAGSSALTATTTWTEYLIGSGLPLTGNDVIGLGIDNDAASIGHHDIGTNCEILVDWIKIDGITISAEGGRVAFDVGDYGFPYEESEAQDGENVIAPPEESSGGDTYLKISQLGSLRFVVGSQAGAYEYDANGNMYWHIVEGSAYNYIFDEENRLAEVKKDEAAGATGTIEAAFTYDGDGRRIKTRHGSSGTFYIGDLYEYTESNCPSSCGKSDVVSYYMANGERVALYQGIEWLGRDLFWSLSDHLGSTTRTIYASSRTVRSDTRYKAWGGDRYYGGGSGQLSSRQYTGQHEEPSIGLYYYNARYYDPSIGRFVSADSLVPDPGSSLSLNRYAYGSNSPLRYNDPSGHCPMCVGVALAVALGFTTRSSAGPNPGNSHDGPSLAPLGAALLLGDVNDVSVIATGYDFIGGQQVSAAERRDTFGINVVLALLPGVSGSLLHVIENEGEDTAKGIVRTIRLPKITPKNEEGVRHMLDWMEDGRGDVYTVDRLGRDARSADALRDVPPIPGMDRDEWPAAIFAEGGSGASVRPMPRGANRSVGGWLRHQLEGVKNGEKVRFVPN